MFLSTEIVLLKLMGKQHVRIEDKEGFFCAWAQSVRDDITM